MTALVEQARPAVQSLMESDEAQLYEVLGMRVKAMEASPDVAGNFDPAVTYTEVAMGPLDTVRNVGQRIFRRWEKEAYSLICGADPEDSADREQVLSAFGLGDPTIVAGLIAGALVSSFGLAPAIAAVVAALIIKRVFTPTVEEFCSIWGERLQK